MSITRILATVHITYKHIMRFDGYLHTGIEIYSDEDVIVQAYSAGDLVNGAFPVLPVTMLGLDYIVASYNHPFAQVTLCYVLS